MYQYDWLLYLIIPYHVHQQIPTSEVHVHLEQTHALYYETMENICLMLDRADPAILSSLSQDLNEAQNLRFVLYNKIVSFIMTQNRQISF